MSKMSKEDQQKMCDAVWLAAGGQPDEMPDYKTFDPRGDSVDKKKPDPEESSKLPFNPCKCSARTYKSGYAVQCTRAQTCGDFCKTHQNQLDALEEGFDLKFGRFDKDRPTHWLNKSDGEKIGWIDTRQSSRGGQPKKIKLKVKDLKEYLSTRIPNESLKGLKKPELEELYHKEKANEESSAEDHSDAETEIMSENDSSPPPLSPVEQPEPEPEPASEPVPPAEPPPAPEPEPASEPEPEPEPASEPEPEPEQDSDSGSEDNGAGTGVSSMGNQVVVAKLPISAYKKLFKENGISTDGLKKSAVAYKARWEVYMAEKKEKEDAAENSEDELDEDREYCEITFEGVDYLEDEVTADIFTPSHSLVGQWNEDCDDIVWADDSARINHESNRD